MEFINSILSYKIYDEIDAKFICIILAFFVFGHLMDSFTVWLLNHFIKKHEKEVASQRALSKQENSNLSDKKNQFASNLLYTISVLRADLLKCLKKPLHVFWLTTGCSLGLYFVKIPDAFEKVGNIAFMVLSAISLWCIIWFILNILNQIVTPKAKAKAKASETPIDEVLYPMIITVVKATLVILGALIVIQRCGGDISAFLTTIGISGAAIALAAQGTIANFFGSLVILLDHPFVIGDWVTINGFEGNVYEIHLRTTKIKTFDDTIVSIPNGILTNTQIDTRGKYKAKMDCSFGVLYSTTPEQIELIVQNIEKYIDSHAVGENHKFEPKHYVYFSGFGDSSLNITVVAYTHETPYKEHVKLKHMFMLEIIRIVKAAGTEFAFPTRTLDLPSSPIRVELNQAIQAQNLVNAFPAEEQIQPPESAITEIKLPELPDTEIVIEKMSETPPESVSDEINTKDNI